MEKVIKQREISIDVFKGFLVICMILAHVILLLGKPVEFPQEYIRQYINLFTFSSFIFIFGYTSSSSYFSNGTHYRKLITASIRILLAYFISGLFYEWLVQSDRLGFSGILSIVSLSISPAYSEFLIAFSITLLVGLLFIRPIRWILARKFWFGFSLFALLLSTFLPYQWVTSNQVGLLIGSNYFYSYPVLQYFGLFLLGMYFHNHHILSPRWLWVVGIFGTFISVASIIIWKFPTRFPPSVGWILESIPFVFLFYLGSQFVCRYRIIRLATVPVGANSLLFLLLSNIMLFGLKSGLPNESLSIGYCLLLSFFILLIICYCVWITRKVQNQAETA
jgi:hypothetical protein